MGTGSYLDKSNLRDFWIVTACWVFVSPVHRDTSARGRRPSDLSGAVGAAAVAAQQDAVAA